mgnify:CR=1 FL=1
MKINIPCAECGCQYCAAEMKSGEKVNIEICKCNDGSGEFEVTIYPEGSNEPLNEKHQCNENELAGCLTSRFNIDLNSMNHQCFN